jgi:tetratricopeptide (TPR) repeat protein
MKYAQAMLLVELGRFTDAATAFDPLLPEIDAIHDPESRVAAYMYAGRALSLSNRTDEGLQLLLRGLPVARDHQLQTFEAVMLENIGIGYRNRGDYQQATAFFDEALKILRNQKGTSEYAYALAHAAATARSNGDLDLAFRLARESLEASATPVARARNRLQLGLCYRDKGDIPAAIAEFRAGLAVDLGSPRHHARTDIKMQLALALTDLPGSSPQDRAEAAKLIADALDISASVHDPFREITAQRIQGQINWRSGRTREALADFNKVLEKAQKLRDLSASADVRSSMTEDEQYAFRDVLDIELDKVAQRRAGELQPASRGELAALLRLERARQRSFGALRVGALDAAATARVDDLLQQMARQSLRIQALVNQDLSGAQTSELQSLQIDMARLHAELDDVRLSAAAKTARLAEVSTPEQQTWRALEPGAAQLSYGFGDRHVWSRRAKRSKCSWPRFRSSMSARRQASMSRPSNRFRRCCCRRASCRPGRLRSTSSPKAASRVCRSRHCDHPPIPRAAWSRPTTSSWSPLC